MPNKVYINPEAAHTWTDTGGDDTLDLGGLAADAVKVGDGTYIDGDVGAVDAAGSTVDLPNLMFLGSAVVQTTTASDQLIISGTVQILSRYVSPVIHNNTQDTLEDTSDAHKFILTPVPSEVQ